MYAACCMLQAVMSSWLPLAEGALTMAVTHLPPPTAAAPLRAPHLTASCAHLPPETLAILPPAAQQQLQHTLACVTASSAAPDAPAVAFISKMVAVPAAALPLAPGERPPADPTREVFLGFGRVFSGVLRPGQRVHVLSPLYNVLAPNQQRCGANPVRWQRTPTPLLQHHLVCHKFARGITPQSVTHDRATKLPWSLKSSQCLKNV